MNVTNQVISGFWKINLDKSKFSFYWESDSVTYMEFNVQNFSSKDLVIFEEICYAVAIQKSDESE